MMIKRSNSSKIIKIINRLFRPGSQSTFSRDRNEPWLHRWGLDGGKTINLSLLNDEIFHKYFENDLYLILKDKSWWWENSQHIFEEFSKSLTKYSKILRWGQNDKNATIANLKKYDIKISKKVTLPIWKYDNNQCFSRQDKKP